jgi:hypothetical protein
MPINRFILALAVSASLTAACSRTPQAASQAAASEPVGMTTSAPSALAPPAADACKLLTAADVETATKVKVGAVVASDPTSAQTGNCNFQHADKAFGTSIIARLAVFKPERMANERHIWADVMRSAPETGVGDFAYYNEAAGVLVAGRGAHMVEVQVLDGPAGAGRLETIKSLAATALGRM